MCRLCDCHRNSFFSAGGGVLIFLFRWLVRLPVKLVCPIVVLLLCMCLPVKMLGRVVQFNILVICLMIVMSSNTLSASLFIYTTNLYHHHGFCKFLGYFYGMGIGLGLYKKSEG